MKPLVEFKSLMEVVNYFSDEKFNLEYLAHFRWGDNITCPRCACKRIYKFSDGITYKCASCRQKFNAKTHSMYEGTKLPLQKWFIAIYEVLANKGISSYTLAKKIGVTQPIAWYRLQCIRKAIANIEHNDKAKLSGVVEADETFVGGRNKNRHKDKKVEKSQGRSFKDKTPVMGILQRATSNAPGKLKAFVVKDTKIKSLRPILFKHVRKGSRLMSDEWKGYNGLKNIFKHKIVNHNAKEYVNEDTYTNGLENFWSQLKRGVIGVYRKVRGRYLDNYVQEFVFRYNNRKNSLCSNFEKVLISGHRIKQHELKLIT